MRKIITTPIKNVNACEDTGIGSFLVLCLHRTYFDKFTKQYITQIVCSFLFVTAINQGLLAQNTFNANDRFEQLGTALPTPNTTRAASGAAGKDYWQQRADYDIQVELNDETQVLTGSETITYFNQSPDVLRYLWLQLDQNIFKKGAVRTVRNMPITPEMTATNLEMATAMTYGDQGTGYNIGTIKDKTGKALSYNINQTMMRIELPTPLLPGQSFSFSIDWNFKVIDFARGGRRTGSEYFAKDGNRIYEMAQFFPRMCVYDDVNGWQNKQYIEQGEFALTFGNYKVAITVPSDHVLGATGELQNITQVLTTAQQKRWEEAKNATTKPIYVVTPDEALNAERSKANTKKTWIFKADNVRDFAFATSRKYMWDAMAVDLNGKKVMCMSYFPKEGNPLWEKYSTQAVAHTIKTYSKFTFDYPYPTAISCNGPVGGMEYPMICFNGPRPETDGTYSAATKYGLIGVVIHEVGHNFFPMIVNNDERQWMWMDEGLDTFLQYLTEKEWDKDYPTNRGEPQNIVEYMKQDPKNLVPIMTTSDNLINAGASAYGKPATALNILRETIMGRELFDYAFKEYSNRWKFKHPKPADFFRTMEDASGVDLDWFWKSWFYGIEPVNQELTEVQWFALDSQNPEINKAQQRKTTTEKRETIARQRDKTFIKETVVEKNPDMKDFYNSYDPYTATDAEKQRYQAYLNSLTTDERALLESGMNFYTLKVKNKGGVPMPVIVKMQFEDGSDSLARFPAEIWRLNDKEISKVITTRKKVTRWTLDPYRETADIDEEDNSYPRQPAQPTRFQLFKTQFPQRTNPMQIEKQQKTGQMGTGKN